MGFSSFWSSITSPRVREITPPKRGQGANDGRPATSSGVRTIRRTPSLEEDGERELNLVESLVTTNIIGPPPALEPTFDEKKSRRRSRGLSFSRSKSDDGPKRRRSFFGGIKDAAQSEEVPEVPTLPTLSAIYSRQAPHTIGDSDRPSTALSGFGRPSSSRAQGSTQTLAPPVTGRSAARLSSPFDTAGEVFELAADPPASVLAAKVATTPKADAELRNTRRRSLGEALSGKRRKSSAVDGLDSKDITATAPPTPSLSAEKSKYGAGSMADNVIKPETRSRRNSNASVASKASKMSRKSKRKSWWQRRKGKDEEVEALPLMPANLNAQTKGASANESRNTKIASPEIVDLSAFPTVPAVKKTRDDDDAASIRTTRSEKATARFNPQPAKSKKRPQSTASHTRRRRKSWWASSNPDDSDDDSNPLPPVPLLIRSNRTTPDSSPFHSGSDNGRTPSYMAVRGDDIKAPRPLSTSSAKSRTYTPRSAAKSFLVSTTPVSDSVRKTVRHSLHACEDLDSGFEKDRGTYCLSEEQQQEWEKLKHLMAVMERRRDVTMKTFGEASVEEMFPVRRPATAGGGGGVEEKEGVKYSNRDALAALEVGVANRCFSDNLSYLAGVAWMQKAPSKCLVKWESPFMASAQ